MRRQLPRHVRPALQIQAHVPPEGAIKLLTQTACKPVRPRSGGVIHVPPEKETVQTHVRATLTRNLCAIAGESIFRLWRAVL